MKGNKIPLYTFLHFCKFLILVRTACLQLRVHLKTVIFANIRRIIYFKISLWAYLTGTLPSQQSDTCKADSFTCLYILRHASLASWVSGFPYSGPTTIPHYWWLTDQRYCYLYLVGYGVPLFSTRPLLLPRHLAYFRLFYNLPLA